MRIRLGLAFGSLALLCAATARSNTYVVTNTHDSGAGSLRQAILDANTNPGADTIAFNIPGSDPGCDGSGVCTIAPVGGLPGITDAVTIDGYTQTGAAVNTAATGTNAVLKIVLSGVNSPGTEGLELAGNTNTIRGLVIGGGFQDGLFAIVASGQTVMGCFIGVDATGNTAFPNGRNGIYFESTDGVTIGSTLPADRNLVSGNGNIGVVVDLEGATGTVVIQGNLVGTNAAGTSAVPNAAVGMSTTSNGVGGSFIIGGSAAGAGNVISGNAAQGLEVFANGSGATAFTVYGNLVGTDATGTLPVPNGAWGIDATAVGAVIGGIGPGEGNVVAYNPGGGVINDGGMFTVNVAIRGNSIHDNGFGQFGHGVGLDLSLNIGGDGVTPNDPGDTDTGPNNFQNFPIVSSATPVLPASGTHVIGTLRSTASTTFDIDFYSNPACIPHPHDFLQGQTYIGSTQVTTDGSGVAAIDVTVAPTIQTGERVSATATDPTGNTSEFSQRMPFTILPASGDPAGGAALTITGTDFVAGATVAIGGVAATNVSISNYNAITANAPALPAGSLNDVTVTDSDGTTGTLPKGYVADFLDVPPTQQFYAYVTKLITNAITVGVGGGLYGVDQPTLRQQMAVFLLKAQHGLCYTPPACTIPVFPDVPCSSNFAPWIDELVAEGITGGCGGGNYCPASSVLRQQMAVFLLKTEHGSSYTPPGCMGVFHDVPCPSQFADWIEQLAAENITGGCGGGNYCPTATANRGQMAAFVVKMFNLE
jgi:IPT/TIG domain/S-layer homology domain